MVRIILFTAVLVLGNLRHVRAQLLETPFDKIHEKIRVYRNQAKINRQTICLEHQVTGTDGRVTTKLDTVEIWDFNKNGRVIKTIRFYSGGYRRILHKYDSIGRKIWEAVYEGESNFPLSGSVTTWAYNQGDYKVIQKNGGYVHVVLKNSPHEDRYLEDGKLAGVTKASFDTASRTHISVNRSADGKLRSRHETVLDEQGRPVEKRTFHDDSSVSSINRFIYNENDNTIEDTYVLQVDGTGDIHIKKYNDKKLVVELTVHLLDGQKIQTQRYFYEYYE